MKMVLLILMFIFTTASLFGQGGKKFTCPMKKGKIVIVERGFGDSNRKPGAEIEGKNSNVYSCSPGLVKAVDTTNGRIVVYIEFEGYFFSYHNFKSVVVTKGQAIKQGETIGSLQGKQRLFLITSKDKDLIDPESILKCKVVHKYIK